MASLFEPNVNQVTPVQDTKVFDALGNIYNFLSKQSQDNQQRKQEQQRINDSLNNLGGINASAASASGANYRAVQRALKGISKVQDRDSRNGARDRATQNALYGRIDKGVSNTNKSLDKLKDSLKSILSGLTDFLKDTLNKSLKQQTDLARTMRKANLSAADKDRIQAYANSVMADVEKLYGNLGVSGDEINDYLGELIASGKDITAMNRDQLASFVALKKGGVEFVHAYGAATQSTSTELKGMVNTLRNVPGVAQAANDTLNKLTLSELAMGGGYAKSLKRISDDAKSTYDQVGATALLAGDMADVMSAQFKYSTGQFHRMNDNDLKLAPFLDNNVKGTWGNLKNADTQFLASIGVINENLAAIGMSQAAGSELSGKYYSDKQVEENNKRNPTEGMLPHALSKAFKDFDSSIGDIFGQLSNRMDEIFGDSADVGKLVRGGFKLVSVLLSTIVFNTTGGALGILFRIGSAALAVSVIKKIIENKDKFKAFLSPVVDTLKSVLPPSIIETFKSIYNTLSNIFKIFVPLIETITRFTSGITDKISEFFAPLAESLSNTSGAINGITSSINNGNESIIDRVFGYLDKKLPDIGKFFGKAITPIASKLLNFLSGLAQQLWENTIKPLIPDLWNLLKDNWPLVLGAFAIKFMPDILGTLLTSVLPKLFINVLPKLISILVAHPAIAAVVGVAVALGAGAKWLWDRGEEKKKAEADAAAAADAHLQAVYAGQDYLAARRQYGANSPEAKHLEGIYHNTLKESEKARQKAASSKLVAESSDTDAREWVDLVNGGLIEQMQTAKESYERLKNTAGIDAKDLERAELKWRQLELKAKVSAINASSHSDYLYDTGDFDSQIAGKTLEEVKADLRKIAQNNKSSIFDDKGVNAMVMDNYRRALESGAISIKQYETLMDDMMSQFKNSNQRGFGDKNKFKWLDEMKANNKKILSAYSDAEIKELATILGVGDIDSKSKDDIIKEMSNTFSTDQIQNQLSAMKGVFEGLRADAKKQTDLDNQLAQLQAERQSKGEKLTSATITDLADKIGLKNQDMINELVNKYASGAATVTIPNGSAPGGFTVNGNGAYADKATLGIFGEAGPEIILPLTKPDKMKSIISKLDDSQKLELYRLITDEYDADYWNNQSEVFAQLKGSSLVDAQQSHNTAVKRYTDLSSEAYIALKKYAKQLFTNLSYTYFGKEYKINNAVKEAIKNLDLSISATRDNEQSKESFVAEAAGKIKDGFNSILGNDYNYEEAVQKLNEWQGGKLAPKDFVALLGPLAREDMRTSGIPASVTLAQAALETGWGKSAKADFRNLFGIKGKGDAGYKYVNTHEIRDGGRVEYKKDNFAQYSSYLESIKAHSRYLLNNTGTPKGLTSKIGGLRYGEALTHIFEPDLFAYLLREGGYATSTSYGKKLVGIMKSHNMYKWDTNNIQLDSTVGSTQRSLIQQSIENKLNTARSAAMLQELLTAEYNRELERYGTASMSNATINTPGNQNSTVNEVTADSAGLSTAQWDVLDDIFGYRAGSVLDYTNRWLTKEFGADITAKQNRDNKSAEDLENYIDEKSLEEYESSHKDLAEKYNNLSLEQKFANYSKDDMLAKSEIYETQSKLLKEGMGAATPKIPAEERVARNAEINDIIDRRVKDKGDILSALTDIASILREVARSTKRPVPTVSKPQGTRFP